MPTIKRHVNKARRRIQNKLADQRRGTASQRGYDRQWRKFRFGFLSDKPLCRYCQTQGRGPVSASICDHVVPHRGDPALFWPAGVVDPQYFFVGCCKSCHDGPKQKVEDYALLSGRNVVEILIDRKMLPPGWPVW